MSVLHRRSPVLVSGVLALLVLMVATCRLEKLLKPSGRSGPVLSVAPMQVRDSARAGTIEVRRANVAITNAGVGTFTWSAAEDYSWIRLSRKQGTPPDTFAIMLDPNSLAPGTYEGKVTITASDVPDSTATIAVTFLIQRPGLVVTPPFVEHFANLNNGPASFSDTLHVLNTGTGVLSWTASKKRPWLTLGNIAGTAPGTIPITINSAGLAKGIYRDTVVVTAPGAAGSPARVPVTLTVSVPGLVVTPPFVLDSSNIGSPTARTDTLRVTNSGTGLLTWTAVKSQPWVTLSRVAGAAPDTVLVTLNPGVLLLPGVYRDTIVFTSPEATNSPIAVPIEFGIEQPVLTVTPPLITDVAVPGETRKRVHDVTIANAGGRGTLAWTAAVADAAPWIALSPLIGPGAGTLTVTLDPTGLAAGAYLAHVVVTAPEAIGSPDTIPVTFSIGRACSQISIVPDVERTGTLSASDCQAPHRPGSLANVYNLSANAGDTLSIRLTATFDAYLILTDAAGTVFAQNDECFPETGTACIMNFPVPAAGHYLIEATTTLPGASGSFTISVVRERPPTPPQLIRQFRKDGVTEILVGTTTPEDGVVIRGTINDPNRSDSVRLEVEIETPGSPFTNEPTHQSQMWAVAGGAVVAVAVPAGGLTNASYRWQARTCDRTGRCSAWIPFGGNAANAADFIVAMPLLPGAKP